MILGILLFIIGFLLGLKDKKNVPFYYVLWVTIIPFLVDLIVPFNDIQELYKMRSFASFYILIMLIYGIFITSFNDFIKKNYKSLIALSVFIIYFLLLSILRDVGFNYYSYLMRHISHILLFFYLTLFTPKVKQIFKFLVVTYLFQILIGLFQKNNFFNFSFNKTSDVASFLTGCMTGNNLYANLLTVISLMIIIECFTSNAHYLIKKRNFLYVSIILGAFLIFMSGIRTSLACFIIGMFIVFIRYRKKFLFPIIMVSVILILFSGFFNNVSSIGQDVSYDWNMSSNSERQSGLLGLFQGWDYIQYSTLSYSVNLLDYFFKNPIIGSGLYFKNHGYDGVVSSLTANQTDVEAALYIAEFGIIGVLLLSYLYKSIVNYSKMQLGSDYNKVFIVFIIILVQTVTDSGIFDVPCMSYFYLYYFYLSQQRK